MVDHPTLGVMVDDVSILFGPDAFGDERVLLLLEAAGNDHAGLGQGDKPERNLASQRVERCRATIKPRGRSVKTRPLTLEHRTSAA